MLLLLVRAGRFWGTFQCSLLAVVRLSHLLPLDRSDAGILLHRCLHRSNGPHRHEARPVQVAAQPLQGARGCQNSQHGDPFVSPHLSEVCCRCWRRCWLTTTRDHDPLRMPAVCFLRRTRWRRSTTFSRSDISLWASSGGSVGTTSGSGWRATQSPSVWALLRSCFSAGGAVSLCYACQRFPGASRI